MATTCTLALRTGSVRELEQRDILASALILRHAPRQSSGLEDVAVETIGYRRLYLVVHLPHLVIGTSYENVNSVRPP